MKIIFDHELRPRAIEKVNYMSYYCKGTICTMAKECMRAEAWGSFPQKDVEEGCTSGVWFVPEEDCICNNYEDGVFQE